MLMFKVLLLRQIIRGGHRCEWYLFSSTTRYFGELACWEAKTEGLIHSSRKSYLFNMLAKVTILQYGCNPTGMTATLERRKEVLRLAREHNFLILEGDYISFVFLNYRPITLFVDDPYYYLYFGKAARPPSYFKLELDEPEVGRVIRFDSFSKILSAGMRMGFVSGPKPILDVIDLHVCT